MSGGSAVAGERNGRAKLTEKDVRAIRYAYKTGRISMPGLAIEFGVSEASIRNIIHYRTWKHIDG